MTYAIIRTRKMATNGQMAGMQKHNDREGKTWSVKNADKDLKPYNQDWSLPGTRTIIEAVDKNIEEHDVKGVRSNSVRCIEVLMTFSPEWFKLEKSDELNDKGVHKLKSTTPGGVQKWKTFKEESLKFLKHKFGDNVISMDAKTMIEVSYHVLMVLVILFADKF